jgi:GT2 family glycosyltransferase
VIDNVGHMDEKFFMYYEEVDLCYRIKEAGWRVVFMPEAVITHLGGRSAGQIPVGKRIMAMTSLLKFFRKHRGKFATGVFNCLFKPAIIVSDVINVAAGAVTYIFAVIVFNKKGREKSAEKVKKSTILLAKYSWRLLFKM